MGKGMYENLLEQFYIPSLTTGASAFINVIIAFIIIFSAIDLMMLMLKTTSNINIKVTFINTSKKLVKIAIILAFLKNYFGVFFYNLYFVAGYVIPSEMANVNLSDSWALYRMLYLPVYALVLRLDPNGAEMLKKIIEARGGEVEYQSAGIIKTAMFYAMKYTQDILNYTVYQEFGIQSVFVILFSLLVFTSLTIAAITNILIIMFVERLNIAISLAFGILLTIGLTDLPVLKQFGGTFFKLIIKVLFRMALLAILLQLVMGDESTYGSITAAKDIINTWGFVPTFSLIIISIKYLIFLYLALRLYRSMESIDW